MLAVVVLLAGASCAYAQEPDPRLAGVWKRHRIGPGNCKGDEFIRVDIDGLQVFVNLKTDGTTEEGEQFQRYDDAKDITINSDGSVSFNVYMSERSYDEQDNLYWTTWTSYTIRWEGGRLKAIEKGEGYGANSQGRIIEDQSNLTRPRHYTYFNINDNW